MGTAPSTLSGLQSLQLFLPGKKQLQAGRGRERRQEEAAGLEGNTAGMQARTARHPPPTGTAAASSHAGPVPSTAHSRPQPRSAAPAHKEPL